MLKKRPVQSFNFSFNEHSKVHFFSWLPNKFSKPQQRRCKDKLILVKTMKKIRFLNMFIKKSATKEIILKQC